MKLKPIETEEDCQQALKRLDEIFDSEYGTREGEELSKLAVLIDNYEKKNHLN